MKRTLNLILLLAIVLLPASAYAQQSGGSETAYVYKPDGTRHCNTAAGVSLDSMAQELVRGGIAVYARRKSHDGREGVAACGNPTGSINVYKIAESDLSKAFELGFQRLDPYWLDSR